MNNPKMYSCIADQINTEENKTKEINKSIEKYQITRGVNNRVYRVYQKSLADST